MATTAIKGRTREEAIAAVKESIRRQHEWFEQADHESESMTMTTKTIDSYRLTDMEEPTDEMLSQIMREAAEEARIKGEAATRKFFEKIRQSAALL